MVAPSALGADYTWSGASTTSSNWSDSANWQGGVAPTPAASVGTLDFPGCPNGTACVPHNDVSGLTVDQLDVGGGVGLDGLGITLNGGFSYGTYGTGGYVRLPITLGASQIWNINTTAGLELGQMSGSSSSLTISVAGPLYLDDTEVGPLTVEGVSYPEYVGGDLNYDDGQPVDLSGVTLRGPSAVGPLTTHGVLIELSGSPGWPYSVGGDVATRGASLDSGAALDFTFGSELASTGSVSLGHAALYGDCRQAGEIGSTEPVVSATGTLNGWFTNTPGGTLYPADCRNAYRIRYHRTASPRTVTATVVGHSVTTLSCAGDALAPGSVLSCEVTVADGEAGDPTRPTGRVVVHSDVSAERPSCVLAAASKSRSVCHLTLRVDYTSAQDSPVAVTADYGGDPNHLGGSGTTYVSPPPVEVPLAMTPSFGTSFSGIVARLHPSGGTGDPSQEQVSIGWGDGAVTHGTLNVSATDASELDVSGSHTYWVPGRVPVTLTLTNNQAHGSRRYRGIAVVASRYAGLGDSYSSGEGAGWPTGQPHPRLPGCNWQLYQDPSGSPVNTDHIDGAAAGPVPGLGRDGCNTIGVSHPFHGNTCHRAITAYAHVVMRKLQVEGLTLKFVACSGAIVHDAYVAKQTDESPKGTSPRNGQQPQASTQVLGSNVSLITLTIGGNDLNFAGVAENCVKDDLPPPLGSGLHNSFDCIAQDHDVIKAMGYVVDPGNSDDGTFAPPNGAYKRIQQQGVSGPLSDVQLAALARGPDGGSDALVQHDDVHDALVLLYRTLKAQAPGARILVLGYPHFFADGGTNGTCQYFSRLEQQWVNDRIDLADKMIQDAAAESGVAQYVDVYDALSGASGEPHQECAGKDIGGPDVNYQVDPQTYEVAPCSGNWINPIDLLAGAFGTPEALHPNPCGHQREGEITADAYTNPPTTLDSFALKSEHAHVTDVAVPPGQDRLNLTVNWLSGELGLKLIDPSGIAHAPVQQGPEVDVPGLGPRPTLYATWDIPNPRPGAWKLAATNETANDAGAVIGSVTQGDQTLVDLPPEGKIQMVDQRCGIFDCSMTFRASVAPGLQTRVGSYWWYDDQGRFQGSTGTNGDTTTLTSFITCFKVILQTNGKGGGSRWSTYQKGDGCDDATEQTSLAMRRTLTPHGKQGRITTLLHHDGSRDWFTARAAGRLIVRWYELPPRSHLARARIRPVLVAVGRVTFSHRGRKQLKVRLTRHGRILLEHSRRIRLAAKYEFKPHHKPAILTFAHFTLHG